MHTLALLPWEKLPVRLPCGSLALLGRSQCLTIDGCERRLTLSRGRQVVAQAEFGPALFRLLLVLIVENTINSPDLTHNPA